MINLYAIILTVIVCRSEARTANTNRNDFNNDIDVNVIQSNPSPIKRFISLSITPPDRVVHALGTTVHLACEAMSTPAPTIRWLKNDEPIHDYNPETNQLLELSETSIAKVSSTLLVSSPSKNLEDVYTCIITSAHLTEKASTIVVTADSNTDLSERYRLMPMKPTIVYAYKDYIDTIGTQVVLVCRAKGHPRPQLYWQDNHGKLILRSDRRMTVLKSGDLLIRKVRWEDMGEFKCFASNSFGQTVWKTFLYPVKAG